MPKVRLTTKFGLRFEMSTISVPELNQLRPRGNPRPSYQGAAFAVTRCESRPLTIFLDGLTSTTGRYHHRAASWSEYGSCLAIGIVSNTAGICQVMPSMQPLCLRGDGFLMVVVDGQSLSGNFIPPRQLGFLERRAVQDHLSNTTRRQKDLVHAASVKARYHEMVR
jgi:hypothetical protein